MSVYIGIDGGGTYTRVAVADAGGQLLSEIEHKGGASIKKNPQANEDVREAIRTALAEAGRAVSDVAGLAAGVADINSDADQEWAQKLTDIRPATFVNDAVIANIGALSDKPGIISIGGTGAITFGITESGQHIRNYDFGQYASVAARFLSYECVYRMVAGEVDETDADLIKAALAHLGVADIRAMAKFGAEGFLPDRPSNIKLFGDFAPAVTNAASGKSNLAKMVCGRAASDVVTSIRMLGTCFEDNTVLVSLIGAVLNSAFVKNAIVTGLAADGNKVYNVIEPAASPAVGAVMLARQCR